MKYRLFLPGLSLLAVLLIATNANNIAAQEELPAPPAEAAPAPTAEPATPAEPVPAPAAETASPAADSEPAPASAEQPPVASETPPASADIPKIAVTQDGFNFPFSMQVLGYNVYSQLAAKEGNANFCFSPQLLAKQLTALRFGADGTTASEILELFPAKVTVGQTSEFLRLVETTSAKLPDGVKPLPLPPTFGSANAVWVPQDHPIVEQYIAGLKTGLATELYAADFKNQRDAAATTINAWARDTTNGRLTLVFAEPYEVTLQGDISVLTTGLACASPRMAVPFNKQFSGNNEFQLLSGEKVSVPMIRQVGPFYGAQNNALQVLAMPCVEENLRLVILLPAPGQLATLEKSMTPQFLAQWFARLQQMPIDVIMPQVQTTACFDLLDIAKSLGMATIATDKADLSNMSQAAEKGPLYVSKLMHETQVNIVEQTDNPQQLSQTQVKFHVNRPFVYMIWNVKTGTPLVIGRVTDPR